METHTDMPPGNTEQPAFRISDGLLVAAALFGGGVAVRAAAEYGLYQPTLMVLLAISVSMQVLVLVAALALARRRGLSVARLILGESSWFVEAAWGIAIAILLWSIALFLWIGLGISFVTRVERIMGQLALGPRLVCAAYAVVLAPLSEEILFRGMIQSSLQRRIGRLLACAIQAVLFAVVHFETLPTTLIVFAVGLCYGAVYLWRKCLLPLIVLHSATNAVPVAWFLALFWLNAHTPAATFQQASQEPDWWSEPPLVSIADGVTGQQQLEIALRYGSRGFQLWKVEARAFAKVRERFPEDDVHGAKALAGIQEIYLRHLKDPRRAINAGRQLLHCYPGQRQCCAWATISNGEAFFIIGDLEEAARWMDTAETKYSDVDGISSSVEAIRVGIQQRRRE